MTIRPLTFLIVLLALILPGFAQQSVENMSTPSSAIDLGEFGKEKINLSYAESFAHPGDMNWFKFNVTEPQKIFLAAAERGIYYGIILYDKNMSYVNAGELILPVTLKRSTYYARIEAYPYKISNYQALNDTLGYTLLAGNSFEKESNDGLNEANDLGTLAKPTMIAGKIDPMSDVDFFKFDVPGGKIGRIEISALTPSLIYNYIDLVLYGYNESDGRYVPVSTDTGSTSMIVKSGSYFLRVEKDTGSDAPDYLSDYVLYLNLSLPEIQNLGTLNKSAALNKSSKIIGSNVDFYEFEVPVLTNVTIETSGESGDSSICLYDSNQSKIECNDDYNGYWSYIGRTLQKGKYYVDVRSLGQDLSYNITIKAANETQTSNSEDWHSFKLS